MTKFIASVLIATAAIAGSAQAMTSNIAPIQLRAIQSYAPNADLSNLTYAEAESLLNIINGGDTENEKRRDVRNALK